MTCLACTSNIGPKINNKSHKSPCQFLCPSQSIMFPFPKFPKVRHFPQQSLHGWESCARLPRFRTEDKQLIETHTKITTNREHQLAVTMLLRLEPLTILPLLHTRMCIRQRHHYGAGAPTHTSTRNKYATTTQRGAVSLPNCLTLIT